MSIDCRMKLHSDYKWVRSEEVVQTDCPTGNDYLGVKYCSQFTSLRLRSANDAFFRLLIEARTSSIILLNSAKSNCCNL